MTKEEKATRYDEALKEAVIAHKDEDRHLKATLERIFPELKESEGEGIRKRLIKLLKNNDEQHYAKEIAWLEKQGDKVSAIEGFETEFERQVSHLIASAINREHEYNEGYVKWIANALLNFAKHELEKQGEQKPADTVEPKFKVGDWIVTNKNHIWYVDENPETTSYLYRLINQYGKVEVAEFEVVDNVARLWTIQDAKDGDVLCSESGWTCIFRALDNHTNTFSSYCFMDSDKWFCNTGCTCHTLDEQFIRAYNFKLHPATKEQRDLLFQKMHEAGYEWDAEHKQLKKIEGESAWSEEDSIMYNRLLSFAESEFGSEYDLVKWFKSLKDRFTWKPSEEQMDALYTYIYNPQYFNSPDPRMELVESVYQDLKKLREE